MTHFRPPLEELDIYLLSSKKGERTPLASTLQPPLSFSLSQLPQTPPSPEKLWDSHPKATLRIRILVIRLERSRSGAEELSSASNSWLRGIRAGTDSGISLRQYQRILLYFNKKGETFTPLLTHIPFLPNGKQKKPTPIKKHFPDKKTNENKCGTEDSTLLKSVQLNYIQWSFWTHTTASLTNEHQRGLSKLMAITVNVSNVVFIPLSANTGLQAEINTRVMVLLLDINYLIYLY